MVVATSVSVIALIIALIALIIAIVALVTKKEETPPPSSPPPDDEEEEEEEENKQPTSEIKYIIREGIIIPGNYFNTPAGTMLFEETLGINLNPNPYGYGQDIYFMIETFVTSNVNIPTGRPSIIQRSTDGSVVVQRTNINDVWTDWFRIS